MFLLAASQEIYTTNSVASEGYEIVIISVIHMYTVIFLSSPEISSHFESENSWSAKCTWKINRCKKEIEEITLSPVTGRRAGCCTRPHTDEDRQGLRKLIYYRCDRF